MIFFFSPSKYTTKRPGRGTEKGGGGRMGGCVGGGGVRGGDDVQQTRDETPLAPHERRWSSCSCCFECIEVSLQIRRVSSMPASSKGMLPIFQHTILYGHMYIHT